MLPLVPLLKTDAALLTNPLLLDGVYDFVLFVDELDCKNWLLILTLPPADMAGFVFDDELISGDVFSLAEAAAALFCRINII